MLIVDDVDSNVLHLELMLRMAGASSVHIVTDARIAVDRCLEVVLDVVLMDLDMPHVDGHAVLSSLRQVLPDQGFLPVFVLTCDSTNQARELALDAGVNDFLVKPYDDVEFVQRVRNLITMRALYRTVHRHNMELQAELDAHAEGHRRVTVERDLRRAAPPMPSLTGHFEWCTSRSSTWPAGRPSASRRWRDSTAILHVPRRPGSPRRPRSTWASSSISPRSRRRSGHSTGLPDVFLSPTCRRRRRSAVVSARPCEASPATGSSSS